jgi:hypothetical protein
MRANPNYIFRFEGCSFQFDTPPANALTFGSLGAGAMVFVLNCSGNSTLIVTPSTQIISQNNYTHPQYLIRLFEPITTHLD